jgi:hypothetical protein
MTGFAVTMQQMAQQHDLRMAGIEATIQRSAQQHDLRMADIEATIQRSTDRTEVRRQRYDLKRAERAERVSQIEHLLTASDGRRDSIKDIKRDLQAILQMLTRKLAGKHPAAE